MRLNEYDNSILNQGVGGQAQERVGDGSPAGEDDGGGGQPFL